MSDVIAILDQGVLQQIGPPLEVYRRPVNQFVADFIGESNLLSGSVSAPDADGHTFTTVMGLGVRLGAETPRGSRESGHMVVRPESVRLGAAAEGAANQYQAEVLEVLYVGDLVKYRVRMDSGDELVAKTLAPSTGGQWQVGQRVIVGWDTGDCLTVND